MLMLPCPAPTTAIVQKVSEEARTGRRAIVVSDFIVTVVAGQVVTVPRRSAVLHANGSITLPLYDE